MTWKSVIGRQVARIFPNRRTFQTMRFEGHCLVQRARNVVDPRHHLAVARLRRERGLSVNVGSGGTNRSGWVHIDAFNHPDVQLALDLRRPLPLRDGQVRRILAEHVIEHVDFRGDVVRVFGEFHRVLEPGGVLRVVVPDAARYLQAYVTGDEALWRSLGWTQETWPADIPTRMDMINHVFHQEGEHQYAYDLETLTLALRQAGFSEIVRQEFGVSLDPELAIDRPIHAAYSLYVDARKGG